MMVREFPNCVTNQMGSDVPFAYSGFNMADAGVMLALMDFDDDLEIEELNEEEDTIEIFSAVSSFMRRDLNRIEGFYEATIPAYTPSEFQSHFRMTKTTFEVISGEIVNTGKIPVGIRRGRHPILPEKQILVFIWCMANQECARLVADHFNITMSSVDRALHRGAEALVELSRAYIKWPNGEFISMNLFCFE